MSLKVLGEAIDFTTNISFTENLVLDVGKNITCSSGSSFVVSGNVYFPDSSKIFIGTNTQTLATTLADGIPKGCIMMWFSGAIPTGWTSCIGGTVNGMTIPDLRGMFIMGSGTDPSDGTVYNVGNTGGNLNHSVALTLNNFPSHQHTGTTSAGGSEHRHRYTATRDNGGSEGAATTTRKDSAGTGTTGDNTHTHANISTGFFGLSSLSLQIIPPYYSLIYIIKTV
jgi:hypothetical protein